MSFTACAAVMLIMKLIALDIIVIRALTVHGRDIAG